MHPNPSAGESICRAWIRYLGPTVSGSAFAKEVIMGLSCWSEVLCYSQFCESNSISSSWITSQLRLVLQRLTHPHGRPTRIPTGAEPHEKPLGIFTPWNVWFKFQVYCPDTWWVAIGSIFNKRLPLNMDTARRLRRQVNKWRSSAVKACTLYLECSWIIRAIVAIWKSETSSRKCSIQCKKNTHWHRV